MDIFQRILHDFLVLFAMVNAVGNLPVFADLTSGLDRAARARAFRVAGLTACSIVLTFAFLGDWMLRALFQVGTGAFQVAGGILVFAVAARGVLMGPRAVAPSSDDHHEDIAIFPLGFPFLAGPGTIVTTILLMQNEGRIVTAGAAILVYLAVVPLLHLARVVERTVGRVGVLVVTRILYVFICAKAVSFVITGLRSSL